MARSWRKVRADAVAKGLDEERVSRAVEVLRDAVQAQKLADIRTARSLTQQGLAERLHVSQARVSKIERGELSSAELGTLESYVGALGGRLRVVAEFDDETVVLH